MRTNEESKGHHKRKKSRSLPCKPALWKGGTYFLLARGKRANWTRSVNASRNIEEVKSSKWSRKIKRRMSMQEVQTHGTEKRKIQRNKRASTPYGKTLNA